MNIEKETILATLPKNKDQDLRVSLIVIAGKPYISVAIHQRDGGLFRGGVTVAPHLLVDLIPILEKALEAARHENPSAI